jgi:4-hydroxybutyrate dehydrogenase/sulfolactaldehyde 3-reductase
MADVAFIGLGAIGLNMAKNILDGGYTVAGYNRSDNAIKKHVKHGGIGAASAAEAALGADVIITMLPNGDAVRNALFAAHGAMETACDGALVIDMSTIHPLESDAIRADLKLKNIRMIDAPVGRTSVEAKMGHALFMVGAQAHDLACVKHILDCMGYTIIECGGPGMGIRMKIVNNLMSTTLNALTAEVLVFSDTMGLDRQLAIDVMNNTPAGKGHLSTTYPAKVLKGDTTPAFMLNLAKKDLAIALDAAEALQVPLTLPSSAEEIYSEAQARNFGNLDWTTLYEMLHKKLYESKE